MAVGKTDSAAGTESVAQTQSVPQTQSVADPEEPARSARFRKLPARIRPEDTFASQDPDAAPDPTMGRDPDRDFMLRNAGF